LIDASGKLLGINTLIYTATSEGADQAAIGINLATPVNLANFVMKDLVNYGTVVRGWLGVSVELLQTPETTLQQQQVLMISGLAEDGPAARAGLQLGDVISAINGSTVNDGRITMHQIARLRPGEVVGIEVARGRERELVQLQAVVGTRPEG
jgi:serine protease DegS